MNIRLLIAGFFVLFSLGCSTISETTSYDYQNHPIDIIADSISDIQFMSILKPYKETVDAKMSEVIANASEPLLSYKPESPLSNFLSDLILRFAVDYCKENQEGINPEIALFNHGGIRASLPKGPIKILNAYELMPFENEMVLVLITGQQLIDLADYISTRGGEGVAGITFGMNHSKAENIKVDGLAVDISRKYWLITSDYIANGGDGMKVLTWAEKRIDTGFKMRDVIIDYLKRSNALGEAIQAKTDGRIYNVE
ncbi:MAG: 5'-nucleotidase C-terminal domain-containing protein [Prolixibacteraceae bacterium]